MSTVGELLKKARQTKKLSQKSLSDKTKIKVEFIDAIERSEWGRLPELAVVQGFVKSLASTIGVAEMRALALLRRDYPKIDIGKPAGEIGKKPFWTPRHTFAVGVAGALLAIFAYVGYQYIRFLAPPKLSVREPSNEQQIDQSEVTVSGVTDPDVSLTANNQPILVAKDGSFFATVKVNPDTSVVEFVATSRSGKRTTLSRSIIVN